MDEQALKVVLDEFLREFKTALDDFIDDVKEAVTPSAESDASTRDLIDQVSSIADTTDRIAGILEDRLNA